VVCLYVYVLDILNFTGILHHCGHIRAEKSPLQSSLRKGSECCIAALCSPHGSLSFSKADVLNSFCFTYLSDPLHEDGATSASPLPAPPGSGAHLPATTILPAAVVQQHSRGPMRAATVPPREAPRQPRFARLQHGRQQYEFRHGNRKC
jgi:hypothetical protein